MRRASGLSDTRHAASEEQSTIAMASSDTRANTHWNLSRNPLASKSERTMPASGMTPDRSEAERKSLQRNGFEHVAIRPEQGGPHVVHVPHPHAFSHGADAHRASEFAGRPAELHASRLSAGAGASIARRVRPGFTSPARTCAACAGPPPPRRRCRRRPPPPPRPRWCPARRRARRDPG